jgi:hypothetical protein
MSEDTQSVIGFVAGGILVLVLIVGGVWGEYMLKKQIIKDALQEVESEKGHK